jgi:hypothetical protein
MEYVAFKEDGSGNPIVHFLPVNSAVWRLIFSTYIAHIYVLYLLFH